MGSLVRAQAEERKKKAAYAAFFDVAFLVRALLEGVSQAIGSNMFEGFVPTPQTVEIIRDYVTGKISVDELILITRTNFHG